jgi:2-C-methyl-D-erythritol 4-phosphate cytidylyltransferase
MKKVKEDSTLKTPQIPQQSTKKRKKVPFAGLNAAIINRNKVKHVNTPILLNTKTIKDKALKKTSVPTVSKNSVLDLAKMLKAKKR